MRKKSLSESAMLNGIEGGEELPTFRILCVSRDLIISCNENNIGWWLKNANYDGETKFWE